ncbi:hypothetical protein SAMN05216464_101593 [Mucilaginibacter pineti]|uniref:Uncharacterized protein n=1 Tax=Mucilaginibacter pineti TaxID=1391627 RepID=A0A1G6UBH5_9SPHI|nr:hypothetical protein SAMN05216464_101593 [Mucilaginibacter pineti]
MNSSTELFLSVCGVDPNIFRGGAGNTSAVFYLVPVLPANAAFVNVFSFEFLGLIIN